MQVVSRLTPGWKRLGGGGGAGGGGGEFQNSKLKYGEALSSVAFSFDLWQYTEGVPLRRLVSPDAAASAGRNMTQTLLCFVLTDGAGGHAFCSRYDLGPWPLLAEVATDG